MAKLQLVAGTTSKSVGIFIPDSSSTIGAGLTGLVFNTASLTAYWYQPGVTAPAAITLATLAATTSAFSSGGFKELDATNCPGHYRLDIPNAVLTGATSAVIVLRGATNMAQIQLEIELTAINNQDAVRGGMTALPNAAAEAAGGLYTRGSGAGQINQPANGQIDANVVKWLGTAPSTPTVAGVPNVNAKTWNDLPTVALPLIPATAGRSLVVDAAGLADANAVKVGPTGAGTAQTARDIGASVLLSPGTGTGQLDITSGVAKANLAQILGTALTETAGLLAGGFKKFFNIATPAATMDHLVLVDTVTTATTATNLTNAPTAGDLTATMKASVTTAATAATPTAAAVTGAVGSVTGLTASDVGAIKAKTDNLPTDPADASDIASSFSGVNTKLDTIDDFLDTEVAAIKSKTDNLPSDPADESLIISATNAIVALIGTPSVTLAADIAAASAPTANQNADALLDRADGVETGVTPRGVLRALLAAMAGVATGGNSTTIVLKNPAGSTTRVTLTVDADGNRSAAVLNV